MDALAFAGKKGRSRVSNLCEGGTPRAVAYLEDLSSCLLSGSINLGLLFESISRTSASALDRKSMSALDRTPVSAPLQISPEACSLHRGCSTGWACSIPAA